MLSYREPMNKSTYGHGSEIPWSETDLADVSKKVERLKAHLQLIDTGTIPSDNLWDENTQSHIWQDSMIRKYIASTMRNNTLKINMIQDAPGTGLAAYLSSGMISLVADPLVKQGRAAIMSKYPHTGDGKGKLLKDDALIDGILESLDISDRESLRSTLNDIVSTSSRLGPVRKYRVATDFMGSADSEAFKMPLDVLGTEAWALQQKLIEEQKSLWHISDAMYAGDWQTNAADDPITLGLEQRERWCTDIAHCANKHKTVEMLRNSILRLEGQGVDPSTVTCGFTDKELENLRDEDVQSTALKFTAAEISEIISRERYGWFSRR